MKNLKSYRALLVIPIGLLVVFISLFLARNPLPENKQAQYSNVFEEIYSDEIAYLKSSFLVQHFSSMPNVSLYTDSTTSDFKNGLIIIGYKSKKLPQGSNIQITSSNNGGERLGISLHIPITDKVTASYDLSYDNEKKTLSKKVAVFDDFKKFSGDDAKSYLAEYKIGNEEIQNNFALIDSTFLTDWVKISDSPYSPSNYGDVKVVDEWKIE